MDKSKSTNLTIDSEITILFSKKKWKEKPVYNNKNVVVGEGVPGNVRRTPCCMRNSQETLSICDHY